MISSFFDGNPDGNRSFLLKGIAIRRKLGRGASCVGAAIAITSIYVESSHETITIRLSKGFQLEYEI